MPALVLCAHRDPAVAGRLGEALARLAGSSISFEHFRRFSDLDARAAIAISTGELPALIFTGVRLQETNGVELIRRLHDEPPLRSAKKILLARAEEVAEADNLLQMGALHGRLDPDFDDATLGLLIRNLLTDFVIQTAPHLIDELHDLLDLRSLAGAFAEARTNLGRLNERLHQVERSVIAADVLSDHQVESGMIEEFDRLLHHPERRHYSPGEVMVREGENPGTIWILLSGRVKLFRTIDGEDVTFHSESAGRIVGLMSLSLQDPIFFSCRAISDVTALVLDRDQISDAIHRSPILSNYLITVILRSMARRNRRSAQLLTQVRTLNARVSEQRDEIASTLDELRQTQEQLVESARMATLGNLAAGMAHELNNPISAILSGVEHLGADLETLIATEPGLTIARTVMPMARCLPPRSTHEERGLRRELAASLEVPETSAARLVAAGITTRADFERLAGFQPTLSQDRVIDQIHRAGQIGNTLRSVSNCASRIAALVRSLKIHARTDDHPTEPTDINATLDDVLLILSARLRGISVHKDFGTLPTIPANPSQLQQVWTNLLTNAAQAMDEHGDIEIRTTLSQPDRIRVEITDHGHGIPPDIADRILEARFTTRSGRVEFGLGLGLPISRNLIRQHGGDLHFESRPGRTTFIADLPVNPNEAKS